MTNDPRRETLTLRLGHLQHRSRAWPTSTSTARSKGTLRGTEKQRSCLSARTSPIRLASDPRQPLPDRLAEFSNSQGTLTLATKWAGGRKKRDLLEIVTSNRRVNGKYLEFRYQIRSLRSRTVFTIEMVPRLGATSNFRRLISHLMKWIKANPEIKFPPDPQFRRRVAYQVDGTRPRKLLLS